MQERHSLQSVLETVREVCRSKRVKFTEVKKLLENLVGADIITDYYVSIGPFPRRADVLLDIFVLSPTCLYNLDIRRSGSLCHRLFLTQLMLIEEVPERTRDGEAYMVCHFYTGIHELMLREKITMRDDIEKFCSKIKDAVLVVQQKR